MGKTKTAKQMERHLKGMANHHRIEILLCVGERDGITLEDIVQILGANGKTIGEHTRRLSHAGLINKKYRGKFVKHTLSPYGKTFVSFLKTFQRIQYHPYKLEFIRMNKKQQMLTHANK